MILKYALRSTHTVSIILNRNSTMPLNDCLFNGTSIELESSYISLLLNTCCLTLRWNYGESHADCVHSDGLFN